MRDDVTARCRSVHRSGITPLGMRFFTPPHASRYRISTERQEHRRVVETGLRLKPACGVVRHR